MKLLAIGTLAALGSGYTFTHLQQAEKPVGLYIDAPAEGIVAIQIPDGDVTVEGWRTNAIEVVGTLDDDNADIRLVSNHGHTGLSLDNDAPVNAQLTIRVPYRSSLDIETTTANVMLGGMNGVVRFESVDGSLTVDGEPRGVVARSTTGNIAIPAANIPGFAHSEHGTVRLGPGTGTTSLARPRNRRSYQFDSDRFANIGVHVAEIVSAAIGSLDLEGLVDFNHLEDQLQFDLSGSLHLDLEDLGDLFDELGDVFDELEDELSDELDQLSEELEALGHDIRHKHRH